MDVSHLQRNAIKIHESLMNANNSLIVKKPCKIYIPEYYIGSALGAIDEDISIVGIFCIVVDNKYYGVSRACALMKIGPSSSNIVDINGSKFYEFNFEVNDKVIKNLDLIRTGTLVYRIYNEFIAKGKIPWYINYEDLCFLFDTAKLHGNADLHTDSALLELIAASMARESDNKKSFYRHDLRLKDTSYHNPPAFIPLKSVGYGATTAVSAVLGAHFNEGLTALLSTPTLEVSSIDKVLRA